ncbi:hypothetical protein [Hymenobacter amundsenii]|nr:hypothetical protein [Hymenobacter amundsenii]
MALIAHYEAERHDLQKQLDGFLAEQEYQMAHKIAQGLKLADTQLRNLSGLTDRLYDEKQHCRSLIQHLKAVAIADEDDLGAAFYEEAIADQEARLQLLESQRAERPIQRTTVLRDTLLKLLLRQIPAFSVVFCQEPLLRCCVRVSRRTVELSLPQVRQLRQNGALVKKQRAQLRALGFSYSDAEDEFLLQLPFIVGNDADAVLYVFMRLAFEVFYFKHEDDPIEIRYYED